MSRGLVLPFRNTLPRIAAEAWVAETAVVIGDTEVDAHANIWFGCVLRGDIAPIRVGAYANIQDGTVVHVSSKLEEGTRIGAKVTIGHMALIHACTLLPPISIPYGAAHASEIQYLFTLPQSVTLAPTQQRLSETMIEYWTQFARTGDPNTFRRHRFPEPFWPLFPGRDEDEDIQSLEPAGVHVESDFATRHHCAFWDAHGI